MDETPYRQGQRARYEGRPVTDCPFQFRTADYASWRGGFSDAVVLLFQEKPVGQNKHAIVLDEANFSRG